VVKVFIRYMQLSLLSEITVSVDQWCTRWCNQLLGEPGKLVWLRSYIYIAGRHQFSNDPTFDPPVWDVCLGCQHGCTKTMSVAFAWL